MLLGSTVALNAQGSSSSFSTGFNLSSKRTFHSSNINDINANDDCCNSLIYGNGSGMNLTFVFEDKLDDDISLDMRFGYTSYNVAFDRTEQTQIFLKNDLVNGSYNKSINIDISEIGISSTLKYSIANFGIRAGLGFSVLNSAIYDTYERIISHESEAEFIDNNGEPTGSNTRGKSTGNLPNASNIAADLVFSMNYDVHLSDRFVFSPEVSLVQGLISPINNFNWNYYHLNYGFSIKYKPFYEKSAIETPLVSVSVFPVNQFGNIQNMIEYRKISETKIIPVLNSIYFDDGSVEIPKRYNLINTQEAGEYYIQPKSSDILGSYHDVLNIIARRMKGNLDSKVRLQSVVFDSESKELSFYLKRAENIRNYMTEVWKIDSSRFILELLKINSNTFEFQKYRSDEKSFNDLIEEQNRVNIIPEDMELIAPIIVNDTNYVMLTEKMTVMPLVAHKNPINSWEFKLSLNNRSYRSLAGKGTLPEKIDFNIDRTLPMNLPSKMHYRLILNTDDNDFEFNGDVEINAVEYYRKNIAYYLIWQDRDEIIPNNFGREMSELINMSVGAETQIIINSYTDNTGFPRTNKIRSEARAEAFSDLIDSKKKSIKIFDESQSLFDNELPEGRVYNRCLEIELIKDQDR